MSVAEIILLGVGLSMDAFAAALCKGIAMKKWNAGYPLIIGGFFGAAQALMPIIGWFLGNNLRKYISAFDHWIAFTLLLLIGGNMIREAFSPEEEQFFNPDRLRTQLMLAVATSIDALAVGISFVCAGYERASQLTVPLVIIGAVSVFFSLFGTWLGSRFGLTISRRLKPGLFGGVILILIGVKILVSHLLT